MYVISLEQQNSFNIFQPHSLKETTTLNGGASFNSFPEGMTFSSLSSSPVLAGSGFIVYFWKIAAKKRKRVSSARDFPRHCSEQFLKKYF